MYGNLQRAISIDDNPTRLLSDEGGESAQSDDSDVHEMLEQSRRVILEELADAYNGAEPGEDMQRLLESDDVMTHLSNCHMYFKCLRNMEFAGVALNDVKVATFRFLYDQVVF